MNWIIYSFLMFSFSVIYYLIFKKLQQSQVDNKINLLFLFLPATPMFVLWILISGKGFNVRLDLLAIILISTYLFSYLGNIYSAKGIQNAPNSGYSLIIQKSYAIYTAVAAIFLFDAELSTKGIVAIIWIIIFSAFIMLGGKAKSRKNDLAWIIPSLLSFFLFGNLVLVSKYLLNEGMDPIVRSFYVNFFVVLMYGFDLYHSRAKVNFSLFTSSKLLIGLAFLMGVTNGLFNAFMQLAFETAPNIGYVNIINTSSIALIAVASAVLFKDSLSLQKIIGLIGILIGLVILLI